MQQYSPVAHTIPQGQGGRAKTAGVWPWFQKNALSFCYCSPVIHARRAPFRIRHHAVRRADPETTVDQVQESRHLRRTYLSAPVPSAGPDTFWQVNALNIKTNPTSRALGGSK